MGKSAPTKTINKYQPKTNKKKYWRHDEYYVGDEDEEQRRCNEGTNCWNGAESIESFTGTFVLDTMHGVGDYKWRNYHESGAPTTYEGHFYANKMHGYGAISYPDGEVFRGLFYNNFRYGPGVVSCPCLSEDVGLWRGRQLVRLSWLPSANAVVPNLISSPAGLALTRNHKITLTAVKNKVGKVNSAIDLLKQCGADAQTAAVRWRHIYPKNCTDLESALCNKSMFEHTYYHGYTSTLTQNGGKGAEEMMPCHDDDKQGDDGEIPNVYYAWNNTRSTIAMMKHCYEHEHQRSDVRLDLTDIVTGLRRQFKSAGKHEMECRSLLMASYLGRTAVVAQLINDSYVCPDVADALGNTPLMYAVCNDNIETMHFLVEAGANVNSYNDSCCTPLGVALIRYLALQRDVPIAYAMEVVLPKESPLASGTQENNIAEWNISRDSPITNNIPKSFSVTAKLGSSRKIKSLQLVKSATAVKKKPFTLRGIGDNEYGSDNDLCDTDRQLYNGLSHEYIIRVTDTFTTTPAGVIQNIYEVNDMVKEFEEYELQIEKPIDKNAKIVPSKILKQPTKPSKEVMWHNGDNDITSINSKDKLKNESLARIKLTILELIEDGANLKNVQCPVAALAMAITANSEDLVHTLLQHGADSNEKYPQLLNYTGLELAISRPLTFENLNVIIALLEGGSRADQRLYYNDSNSTTDDKELGALGPTLLHAVLGKHTETEVEIEIQGRLLELLLNYGSDATAQFKGKSAVDVAITRNMDLLCCFVKNPKVILNNIINGDNQTILTKIFNLKFFRIMERDEILTTLTDLLLFGADPLLQCQNGEQVLQNLFVYAKEQLLNADEEATEKVHTKGAKSTDKQSMKSTVQLKTKVEDIEDYKQALQLVSECSRLIHIRWLQAQLLRELIDVVNKFKHRHWSIIIKEHKRQHETTLWVTAQRSLEIWDVLKTSNKKVYNDRKVLKLLLCIIQYYNCRHKLIKKLTAQEKHMIEGDVSNLLREYYTASITADEMKWKQHYVKPELDIGKRKFEICFECSMPFIEEGINCRRCKMVSFCSIECIRLNVNRTSCHPCRLYMKEQFFPTYEE